MRMQQLSVRTALAATLLALLAACGGGGGNDDDDDDPTVDLVAAFAVVGQSDYSGNQSNRGTGVEANTLAQPQGKAAYRAEYGLLIADYGNSRALAWDSLPVDGEAAALVIGQDSFTDSGASAGSTRLALPTNAAFSATGHLLITDSGNNRVLIWSQRPAANTPADLVIGQTDLTQNQSGTSATQLDNPTSAMIAGNRLFVVDQGNSRVLIWNSIPTTNGVAADVVVGQDDFVTATADEGADRLNRPSDLWTDGFRLLVADTGNNRVLLWDQIPRSNGKDASLVIGQADFFRTTSGTSAAALRAPLSVTSDGVRIYVADAGNHRVAVMDAFPILSGESFDTLYGQQEFSYRVANDDDQDLERDDQPSARVLDTPTGVHVADGVLIVSDRNNHRALMFTP